uniref:C2H2-type domain-containing protein n=1 Tax=Anopheles stephensi TaxID=30069 RepID=A0A182YHH6_ANOST
MEGRVVEYSRPGGGLDYHNSPLIGEIAAGGDYSQFHRSIDQLRSLNERGILASASNTQLTVTFTPIQNNGPNNPSVLGYNQQQQQQQQQQLPVQQVLQQHQQHPQLPQQQHHLQQQQQQQQHHKPFLPNGIVPHSNNLNPIGGVPGNITLAVNGLLVGSNGVPLVDDRLNNNHLGVDSSNHRPNATVNPSGQVPPAAQRPNGGGGPNPVPVAVNAGVSNVPSTTNGGPSTATAVGSGGGVNAGPTNAAGDQIDLELKQFIVEKKELDSSCPSSPTNGVLLMQGQQQLLADSDDLLDSKDSKTDKPFKCNSCYKCFSDEPSLLEHIPKHKESKHLKTHICQYCGKSYTQETYLSKHMQKHAERTDKRPPIGARSSSSTVNLSASTPGSSNSSGSGSASNGATTTAGPATMTGESTFWPKVSPDSAAATINDVINQQNNHHDFSLTPNGSATNGSNGSTGNGPNATNGPQSQGGGNTVHGAGSDLPGAHHQRDDAVDELVGPARGPPDNANTPNGSSNTGPGNQPAAQQQQQQQQQQPPPQQQHNGTATTMNGNLAIPPVSTPMSASYDSNSIAKATSNSAFTPINAMPPHLNSLQHHHQLATQRPSYLYDAISFQNQKSAMAQSPSNAFPNQLISLHQIRNYAHQPAGGLMAGEHLLGVTVGPGGKDKG